MARRTSVARNVAGETEPGRPLDLDNIKAFLKRIGSPKAAHNFNNAKEKALFHYTDLIALKGILGEDDLWLTNCRFCNDDGEMRYGYRIAHDVIEEELRAKPGNRPFFERLRAHLDPLAPDDVYICCFCIGSNLLSQWRAYGANGTGVSFEIEAKQFGWATGDQMPLGAMRLWRVEYEEAEQKDIIRAAIKFGRDKPARPVEQRARAAAEAIRFFIPTFKSKDFSEEQEYRLIFTPGPNCLVPADFRISRQTLVPYYSLRKLLVAASKALPGDHFAEGAKLPIVKVLVGPSPRGLLNKESIRMLLAQCAYSHVPVDVSQISYRGV